MAKTPFDETWYDPDDTVDGINKGGKWNTYSDSLSVDDANKIISNLKYLKNNTEAGTPVNEAYVASAIQGAIANTVTKDYMNEHVDSSVQDKIMEVLPNVETAVIATVKNDIGTEISAISERVSSLEENPSGEITKVTLIQDGNINTLIYQNWENIVKAELVFNNNVTISTTVRDLSGDTESETSSVTINSGSIIYFHPSCKNKIQYGEYSYVLHSTLNLSQMLTITSGTFLTSLSIEGFDMSKTPLRYINGSVYGISTEDMTFSLYVKE